MEHVQLSLAGGDFSLSVRQFSVRERISAGFVVNVVARSPLEDVPMAAVVGQKAGLSLVSALGGERLWRGICSEMRLARVEQSGLSTYELTIVPSIHRLTLRRENRLFQHKSIVEIVKSILDEHGIEHVFRLTNAGLPPLELRTQYMETDDTFVRRLLEEAGISFYFEDAGESASTLVLHDAPQTNGVRSGLPLTFVDSPGQAQAGKLEHITALQVIERDLPARWTVADYDFRRPRFPLQGRADASPPDVLAEQYTYEPGVMLAEMRHAPRGTTASDDLGVARFDPQRGAERTRLDRDAAHAGKTAVTFETNVVELPPGTVVTTVGHPRPELAPGKRLLITSLELSGEIASVEPWLIRAVTQPAEKPFRPARVTPKPQMFGLQTAVVVGDRSALEGDSNLAGQAFAEEMLAGNEVYTDELGRVRVQFPWDREGELSPASSIWMRVSQGWAGAGYGMFTIPRIGQEVLVAYLGGDVDSPVVVGRVHNEVQPPPYPLPRNQTVSTWKTASSPAGDGFNELRFDDGQGREHVYLQAERDMDRLVKKDLREAVGHDHTRYVQNRESIAIGHDRTKVVHHNEIDATGLNRMEVVGLNRASTVGVEESTHVGTRWSVTVARGLTGRVARELDRIAKGPLSGVLAGAARSVLGALPGDPTGNTADAALSQFGRAAAEKLKALITTAAENAAEAGPPPTSIEVVDRQIKLTTGEASIILDGPNITFTAQGAITLHAHKSVSVLSEEEAVIASRGRSALISATDDVIVQGKKTVHLNPYQASGTLSEIASIEGASGGPRCARCGEALSETADGLMCPSHGVPGMEDTLGETEEPDDVADPNVATDYDASEQST
ncbi:MAG: type VI secretion system tip protein VgrG [Polyangiaceae bacterium]|nr:type VI secretion system tip protein VgrG [Polyangiaceae bacterium]